MGWGRLRWTPRLAKLPQYISSEGIATVLYCKGKTLETISLYIVKGYVDDLSIFSSSMTEDNAAALQTIDKHWLDLILKPSKLMVSFIYDGKKVLRNITLLLKDGSTRNISPSPTNSWDTPFATPCQPQLRNKARDSWLPFWRSWIASHYIRLII